jgi:hypothetical protein
MIRRNFPGLLSATSSLLMQSATPFLQSATRASNSGFAPVNGLQLYYEIHGNGKPLILLHGGVSASEACGVNLQELAKT